MLEVFGGPCHENDHRDTSRRSAFVPSLDGGVERRAGGDIRSNIVEEVSDKMRGTSIWSNNEYHERCDVDCRMEQQERKSFAKIVAGTTEEYLGAELDCLTRDGDIVEQGHGICLSAIRILQRLQPQVEVVGRYGVACEGPSDSEGPKLPEREAAEEVLECDPNLRLAADSTCASQCNLDVSWL